MVPFQLLAVAAALFCGREIPVTCRSETQLSERSVVLISCWRIFLLAIASVACLTLLVAVSHSKLWEPILIASVGGLIPGLGIHLYCSILSSGSAQKFGPVLLRPSPTTYPENGTNPCADLVEVESLVICEEITWRPSSFWSLVSVDCRPRSVVFTSNINQVPASNARQFFTSNQVLGSNTRQFIPVTLNQ